MDILITNDDGWGAKGIVTLVKEMVVLGNVTVIAPESARSGQSNAITVNMPIRMHRLPEDSRFPEAAIYTCTGTPSDCIKLALNTVFRERKPDLVVSGINHGSNAAINVIYSGTMGACFVAAENGIPAIGFSLCDHNPDADFSFLKPYILPLTRQLLQQKAPYGVCYNINAPIGPLQGTRFTRQCRGNWVREMREYTDPNGGTFYLLTGEFSNHEPMAQDTDEWALGHGYVSITPDSIDMTVHSMVELGN